MPDISLPITFGPFNLHQHQITTWTLSTDRKRYVTGSINGDIIVWDAAFNPIIKMCPHLQYHVGAVTALQIMKRPFAEFQDSKMNCVVAINQDKRMRLWSMNDGRLLLLSDHDQFHFTQTITSILPIGERDSRYVVCFGEGTAVYIYDLWKMCCSKIFQINDEFDSPKFIILNQHLMDIALIDSKLRIYKIDTKIFKKEERQNYLKYVHKKQQIKSSKQKQSLIRLVSSYSLKGLPNKKVINSLYHNKQQILYIVYSKQIVAVYQPYIDSEQQREMCFITSSVSVAKFRNVHACKHNDQQIIIIEQIDGTCTFLLEAEIMNLFYLINKGVNSSITLGFGGFAFQKQSSNPIAHIQLILRSQLPPAKIPKYFCQQMIYAIKDLIIRQNGTKLEFFTLNSIEQIKFCSLEPIYDTKVQSEGQTLYVNIHAPVINENLKSYQLEDIYLKTDDLIAYERLDFLNTYVKDVPETIKDKLSNCINEKNYVYTLGLYHKSDLFFILGTNSGSIHIIPFFYDKSLQYNTYNYECSSNKIIKLLFRKNSLFVVDSLYQLYVFSFSIIFGKFEYQNVQIEPTYICSLPSNLDSILEIRELKNHIPNFPEAGVEQIKRKIIKHLIAFKLKDDSIFLYHTTMNTKQFILQDIHPNIQGQVKLYYLPQIMYFLVQKGDKVSIWTIERGSFERNVNIMYLMDLVNLEEYLQNQLKQAKNPFDFRTFKTDEVSQLDLLEFSNRHYANQHNFSKEIYQMSSKYFYDQLGLLQKLEQNAFQLEELLNIVYPESSSVVAHSKFCVIYEYFEQKDLFLLFDTYLKQFKTSKPFKRVNKAFKEENQDEYEFEHPSFLFWFECKQSVAKAKECIENQSKLPLLYSSFYQPSNLYPIFKTNFGLQGMGEGFSRTYQFDQWQQSGLMSAQYGIAAAFCMKYTQLRFQIDNFQFKPSLLSLARFTLDKDKDIIDIACQIIYQQIKRSNQLSNDLITLQRSSREILLFFEKNSHNGLFPLEIMCLVLQTYLSLQVTHNDEMNNFIFNRINQTLNHQLCLNNPKVVFIFLKLLDDGITIFSKCIPNPKNHLSKLILLYYYIYTAYKNKHFLNDLFYQYNAKKSKEKEKEKERVELLMKYSALAQKDVRRMKQIFRQVILTHCKIFFDDFKQCLKDTNDSTHPMINSCMIDLLLNLSKQQVEPRDLQFFLDFSIKTVDQYNPIQRRYSYKILVKFITFLDLKYKYVSYSEERQKVAFANEGIIQIYDLRYGVKLTSLDRYQSQITSVAFDSKGTQLATYSNKDQNLKIFILKPTGSFLQSYENVYIKISHQFNNVKSGDYQLEWDEDCQYLYLSSSEESYVFKVD